MKKPPATQPPLPANLTGFERYLHRRRRFLALWSFIVALLAGILIAPFNGPRRAPHNSMLQQTRQLGQILASYAVDHDGHYPTGKSSTEIFQQLIDQNYVTDPSLFYVRMDGKTVATSNHLKAENVSYDVTDAVTQDDPDMLPIVFTTGYKIDYRAGAKPMLLPGGYTDGMAIFYKSNNAVFISASSLSIPQGFDPKGKTYRQLTPNGPLP